MTDEMNGLVNIISSTAVPPHQIYFDTRTSTAEPITEHTFVMMADDIEANGDPRKREWLRLRRNVHG